MGWFTSFTSAVVRGQLGAYPAKLGETDVIVVGRIIQAASGDCLHDSVPLALIMTDELAALLDLSEARS